MSIHTRIFYAIIFISVFLFSSCEDFVEIEQPDHLITREAVFNSDATASNALNGIYNQLFRNSYANGGNRSVTFLGGISADNFKVTSNINEIIEFGQNNITPPNSWNLDLWSSAYNVVYMTNAILEGINGPNNLSEETKKSLEGEAKFLRAFTYFYLTNLYKDVPLILSTDYQQNAITSKTDSNQIYEQVILDLEEALPLVPQDYINGERTRPNTFAVIAFLARVHLYLGNWQEAENYSTQVIEHTALYKLLDDPNEVFLANSEEAIWQLSPIGWGTSFTHTMEGNLFIATPTNNTLVTLSQDFMELWEDSQDNRFTNWVDSLSTNNQNKFYPHKYKVQYDASGGQIGEYSMVLRLAEQYLIRAEARARMGEVNEAITDIDTLRSRANISLLSETQQDLNQEELLNLILEERRKELFAEWGHRWFDLRRFGASSILSEKEDTTWEEKSLWLPIPEDELFKNPNLIQNEGY